MNKKLIALAVLGACGAPAVMAQTAKAFFQLETGFHPEQNDVAGAASSWAGRNSGVGLQGAWGSVLLGRWDTPYKVTTIAVDPYGDLTLGGITGAVSGSGVRGVQAQFDRRDQNVVQYWSPTMAGFAVRLSYSANEGRCTTPTATGCVNPGSNGGSVTWTGGPIYVGYAYHELKDQTFGAPTLP